MSRMNDAKGNMYEWVSKTWDPFRPHLCAHECVYCYAKKIRERFGNPFTDTPILDMPFPDLGAKHRIFVGHMSDICAPNVIEAQINEIFDHVGQFSNDYIFQSKNPKRFMEHIAGLSRIRYMFGTTIETNRRIEDTISKAPDPVDRAEALIDLKSEGFKTFITIEPIMDFDVIHLVEIIGAADPDFVNIGADSKGSKLVEPCAWKVRKLVEDLQQRGYEIREKHNLERLLKG